MKTVHFVYAHGPKKSCPNAISTELTSRLVRANYRVVQYPWDEMGRIRPSKGDILLGHPHGLPFTYFRESVRRSEWSRRIVLYPYSHGCLDHSSFIDLMIKDCDLFLAITGSYWFKRIQESRLRHWWPKMKHLDLAVNGTDFPFIKHSFNPPGKRRFVYIGGSDRHKNTGYLNQLARDCPEMEFGWIGTCKRKSPWLRNHGYIDFQTNDGRNVVSGYDFLLTVGHADANPATILESMAWGLVPVCTVQSGYEEPDGVFNIPLNDADAARTVLQRLQSLPEDALRAVQNDNLQRLVSRYNWDRFAQAVIDAIESRESPSIESQSTFNRLAIRANTWCWSPRSCFLRPSVINYFIMTAKRSLKNLAKSRPLPYVL